MKTIKIGVILVFGIFALVSLGSQYFIAGAQTTKYEWNLPKGFPTPIVPKENPMTDAKVELGRHLFYEKSLSINERSSCATCHLQKHAFAEPKTVSIGTTGEIHSRNSMSLANVVYSPSLNWSNAPMTHLETQILTPIFGETPIELGMAGKEDLLLQRLKGKKIYEELFTKAFPDSKEKYTIDQITKALASFVRSMISGNSPYDKYRYQNVSEAISVSAKRGEEMFFSERFECFDCHVGFNLSGSQKFVGRESTELGFENNGLYNLDGKGAYPLDNTGLFEFTGKPEDIGKFKIPTLRNVELTAPYMHDGSIVTLEDVVDHYRVGGRTIITGKFAGNGSLNPNKSSFVGGFDLTAQEKLDLIAFLKSLTDKEFISDPRFSDPWKKK